MLVNAYKQEFTILNEEKQTCIDKDSPCSYNIDEHTASSIQKRA